MATGFDKLMSMQQVGVGKARVGAPPAPDPNKEGIIVYVAVFLDGTKNNRYNTALKRTKTAEAQRVMKNIDEHDSYDNYYSNVSILEEMNKRRVPAKYEVSVYVEGEGTNYNLDEKTGRATYYDDDQQGYAFGSGVTGIDKKVNKAIRFVRERILKPKFYDSTKQYIKEIKVDAFGFSRGAAAARHFISRRAGLRTWKDQPAAATVTVKFVGLFDTVSSYDNTEARLGNVGRGLGHLGNPHEATEFSNDVRELGLAIGGNAKCVVHLVAGNEYRVNFASTTIASSLAANVGYELVLPGAHSDIGGGYAEEVEEEREFHDDAEYTRFVGGGWYTTAQLHRPWNRGSALFNYVGTRRIRYEYQYVSLFIMVMLATKSGLELELAAVDEAALGFTERRFRQHSVPAELLAVGREFTTLALGNFHLPKRLAVRLPENTAGREVRRRYLHRSDSKDMGMNTLRDKAGWAIRHDIIG